MIKVLVTGAGGQLGLSLFSLSQNYANTIEFIFKTSTDLDIINEEEVYNDFGLNEYDYCINCAAYTNVDKAESNIKLANSVNSQGALNLALACKKYKTTLIHCSTDFVFEGTKSTPYNEGDIPKPLGQYGRSKLIGENAIVANLSQYYILRTSWLYSEFGNNFMKSMLRLGAERKELSIVYDQIGTPTYAVDLASCILSIITKDTKQYGIYNYSNEGVASWYDFAVAIFNLAKLPTLVLPIRSKEYPLPAKRPSYSVLDKRKIRENLKVTIPHWQESLSRAFIAFKEQRQTTFKQKKKQL